MSGGPMATFRENVNLDDPADVERAVTEAETEEAKSAILAAASSMPIGRATLRVGLEPVKVEKGMVNPQTGEAMEEDGVALRQSVMFSWVTEEYDWCPQGSDCRKELGVVVPYFQAMLAASLLEHAVSILEKRTPLTGEDPMAEWKAGMRKLADTTLLLMQPPMEDVLRWLGDRTGAWAEAEALLGKEGVS